MKEINLQIELYGATQTVELREEVSFGRTDAAQIVIDDDGLSRLNTSFFRDGEQIFVVDENSTNGTFVNGERISGRPREIFIGDTIKIGSQTQIKVQSPAEVQSPKSKVQSPSAEVQNPTEKSPSATAGNPKSKIQNPKSEKPPMLLIAAGGSFFLIIFAALGALLLANKFDGGGNTGVLKGKPKIVASAAIPIRVVDPLGGEEPESLDEMIQAWEVQDAEFDVNNLQAVTTTSADAPQLAVSVEDWKTQRDLAMGRRSAPTGLVSGVTIPPELSGGITKQLVKFRELGITRAKLPKDFAALARLRAANQLVELPLATKFYYLDNIGTSADGAAFDSFDSITRIKLPLLPGSEDYSIIQALAANYNGQKYNLDDPASRLQMKRRLLRMFHPRAKAFLEELGAAYQGKFNRPLKVTSLTRSLEYQFDLTKDTRNAYRGETPPHSTGATFDLAYMQMTAEEQNFVLGKLAEYERAGRIDALREVAQTPCLHIFVFP